MYHAGDLHCFTTRRVPFLRIDSNMSHNYLQLHYQLHLLHYYSYSLIYDATFAKDGDDGLPFNGDDDDEEAYDEGHVEQVIKRMCLPSLYWA